MMEIGQGSSAAIQKTIASMGANNLLIMPGQATSGGVSFGAGSTMTLTPGDADAIRRDCPAVRAVAPLVRARVQVVYGNKNWVPMYIYGTTPDFLDVRDWTDLAEGDAFTDRDVPQRQQGLPARPDRWSASCSTTSRRSARRSASRTSRSRSSACWRPRAPT